MKEIKAVVVLNEDNPEFFSELLKKGVDAVEPEMDKQLDKINEDKMNKISISEEELEFLKESNAIEGEYSEEALQDAQQAWMMAKIISKTEPISIEYILGIHRRLMKRLNPKIAGKIRDCPVMIGGKTKWNDKEEIKEELRLLCNPGLYPTFSEDLIKRWHIQFEAIHPFEDGNGRTGRILMNIQRLKIGLPILIIHEGKEQMEYYKWFKEKNSQ